jgi:hypothetical protein
MFSFGAYQVPQDPDQLVETLRVAQKEVIGSAGNNKGALGYFQAVKDGLLSLDISFWTDPETSTSTLIQGTAEEFHRQFHINQNSVDDKVEILRTIWISGLMECIKSAPIIADIFLYALDDPSKHVREEAAFCLYISTRPESLSAPLVHEIRKRADEFILRLNRIIEDDISDSSKIEMGGVADFAFGILKKFEEPKRIGFTSLGLSLKRKV